MEHLCLKCNKNIPEKVHKYSREKYGKSLCRECQKISNKKEMFSKKQNNVSEGLTKKESQYKESMIKGRIAETLIEELFLSLGYNVFRYGMENTVPGVIKLLKNVRGDVANNIRRMPDFVVQNPSTNQAYFVEVKFRKDGCFDKTDKSIQDYPYKNTYFIVVSKKHIKCITYEELQRNKEVSSKSRNWLGDKDEFKLDKKTIIDFCEFAKKFFESV